MFRPQKIDFTLRTSASLMKARAPVGAVEIWPKPPVRSALAGVTSMLAPTARSSRLTLSPMSSITPSMAVETAEPMAMAATIRALRRGARLIDSLTKRSSMGSGGLAEYFKARLEGGGVDHERAVIHVRDRAESDCSRLSSPPSMSGFPTRNCGKSTADPSDKSPACRRSCRRRRRWR